MSNQDRAVEKAFDERLLRQLQQRRPPVGRVDRLAVGGGGVHMGVIYPLARLGTSGEGGSASIHDIIKVSETQFG